MSGEVRASGQSVRRDPVTLHLQQSLLAFLSAGIARQPSTSSHHPVAGDYQHDRIARHRVADGLRRHAVVANGPGQLRGQRAVSDSLPVGDGLQKPPDGLLERGATQGYRRCRREFGSAEIGFQPLRSLTQHRVCNVGHSSDRGCRIVTAKPSGRRRLPVETKAHKRCAVRDQHNVPQRRGTTTKMQHRLGHPHGNTVRVTSGSSTT